VTQEAGEEFLRARGAEGIPHPGGTLYAHLGRVADTLAAWGAPTALQLAGLCHAAYGTDGFAVALLDLSDRAVLVDAIGAEAEALVYRYGSCDRDAVYPRFGRPVPLVFTDRFSGATTVPEDAQVRAFVELTAANELDVLAHNESLFTRYRSGLLDLFTRARPWLSSAAWQAVVGQLGAGVHLVGLDHLVLTVADVPRTVDFYVRVLGMRSVEFGDGRRAVSFGTSKINLHEAGRELSPRAARATPGSGDLCFVTGTPIEDVVAQLAREGVAVEEGPVARTGALGEMTSVYFRDPDGNLIEVSAYA
jgi:catechol 2,3-dioxygenase-like lactoylglutathione lyase family enzyme